MLSSLLASVFVRKDHDQVINVKYATHLLLFEFYRDIDRQLKFDGEAMLDGIKYPVDKFVYYQKMNNTKYGEPFEGYILEIEDSREGSKVHMHRVVFVQEKEMTMHLVEHETFAMTLDEFLDCPIVIESEEMLKGEAIVWRSSGDLSLHAF